MAYESEYIAVARKAKEIASKLGHDIISEGYYNDECIGAEYEYEELKIEDYGTTIRIYIDDELVLKYNEETKDVDYCDGSWTELIETIYNEIPNIEYEKSNRSEEIKEIYNEMDSIEEYFKLYINLSKKGGHIFSELQSYLLVEDIEIKKCKRKSYLNNLCTGDDMETTHSAYEVYYDDEKVAEFNNNIFNIFPNKSYYGRLFIPGYWTYRFKDTMEQFKGEYEESLQQRVSDTANRLIKSFKNNRY